MSGPTDKPLARADSHLAACRYAEAAGAYRAVLCIDPHEHRAHLGLADCSLGRGQLEEAIEELVAAAQDFAERGALEPAFALITKALTIDPTRLELHIDVAELEASAGRIDIATSRLRSLAAVYESAGRIDEAQAVLEAAVAFMAMDEAEEDVPEPGTTTLVTPTVLKLVDDHAPPGLVDDHAPPGLVDDHAPPGLVDDHAVPAVVQETHTIPQHVMPSRTGDTFVGPAPGPRPRAEQTVARTAARRSQGVPALSWRPSTIQMQALAADIPGVPKKMAPMRTAPIVHAPKRAVTRKPEPKLAVAAREPAAPKLAIAAKAPEPPKLAIAAKPEPPARKALEIRPLPGRAKPRPAPAPVAKRVEPKARPLPPQPASKPMPPKVAAAKPKPVKVAAKPKPSKAPAKTPAPKGESLADRLRRQSGRPNEVAAKRNAAAVPTETFDEDATSLWCPEQLLLPNRQVNQ